MMFVGCLEDPNLETSLKLAELTSWSLVTATSICNNRIGLLQVPKSSIRTFIQLLSALYWVVSVPARL
jgi:hypothetical protein